MGGNLKPIRVLLSHVPGILKEILKLFIRMIVPKKLVPLVYALQFQSRYFGAKFECLFCGGHFRRLLPEGLDLPVFKEKRIVGGGYRVDATCPRCYSCDRERLLYLYLTHKTNIFQCNLRVLHIAPELQLQRVLKTKENLDYITADLQDPTAMVRMDITCINYPDNSFDAIICNHVLEHIGDDRRALAELYRVLKPRGWAILQVPIALSLDATFEDSSVTIAAEREKLFGQKDHVRIYGRDYKERLETTGFTVRVDQFVKQLGPLLIRKYALLKDEDIYLCTKHGPSANALGPVSRGLNIPTTINTSNRQLRMITAVPLHDR